MGEGGGGGGSVLRELLVAFGISIDDGGLAGFGEKVDGVKEKLKQLAEIVGAGFLGEKMKEFVQGQIEAGGALKRTASMLGTSTDELQALQLAAGSAGIPVEEMTTGLRFLNRNMAEAATGSGDAAQLFAKFGIHLKDSAGEVRPAGDVMQDLADHLSGMKDPAEKTAAAMKLLGRGGAALLPLLNKGAKAFDGAREAMEALGGGMSEEFTEKAEEAEGAQYRLTFAMTGFKSMVAAQFLPSVVAVAEKITGWVAGMINLAKHTNVLRTAFLAVNIGGAIAMFMKLSKVLGLAKLGFTGVVRALLGFAAPILLVGGLYLIFDDLFTLMTGGKSLIGDLLDKYQGVGSAQKLAENLRDVWQEITDLWTEAGPIIKTALVEGLKSAFDLAAGIVRSLLGAYHYTMAIGYLAYGNAKDRDAEFAKGDASMKKGLSDFGDAFKAEQEDPTGGPRPTAPGGRTAVSVRQPLSMTRGDGGPTIVHQTVKSHVQVTTGSGDPGSIGRAVADGVSDGHQKALQDAAAAMGAGG